MKEKGERSGRGGVKGRAGGIGEERRTGNERGEEKMDE